MKCESLIPDYIQEIHCTNEFYFGSCCEVSCKNSSTYYIKGDSKIICGVDGNWNKHLPKCLGKSIFKISHTLNQYTVLSVAQCGTDLN